MINQPSKLTFDIPLRFVRRTIRLNLVWLVFASTFIYVFVSLGQWQLSRAVEKEQLITASEQRLVSESIALSQNTYKTIQDYQPVSVEGTHYQGLIVYVANEPYQSRDGYHIYVPVELNFNQAIVWVNLGWVGAQGDRRQLPDIKEINQSIKIEGYGYYSKGQPLLFEHALSQYRDNVWLLQGRDYDLLFSVLSERKSNSLPYIIRTTKKSDDGLIKDWVIVSMKPDKHIAYAVQWFGLAAAVGVIFLFLTVKRTNLGVDNGSK